MWQREGSDCQCARSLYTGHGILFRPHLLHHIHDRHPDGRGAPLPPCRTAVEIETCTCGGQSGVEFDEQEKSRAILAQRAATWQLSHQYYFADGGAGRTPKTTKDRWKGRMMVRSLIRTTAVIQRHVTVRANKWSQQEVGERINCPLCSRAWRESGCGQQNATLRA